MADQLFTDGAAYERLMGRWSRVVGHAFLDWVNAPKHLRWLDAGEPSQVISTSARSLFLLVERGQFMADLFYRLNVLRVDVK